MFGLVGKKNVMQPKSCVGLEVKDLDLLNPSLLAN